MHTVRALSTNTCASLSIEAILLLVAAGPADGVDQTVSQLQQTDDELQHSEAQRHTQKSDVPLHNIKWLKAP